MKIAELVEAYVSLTEELDELKGQRNMLLRQLEHQLSKTKEFQSTRFRAVSYRVGSCVVRTYTRQGYSATRVYRHNNKT